MSTCCNWPQLQRCRPSGCKLLLFVPLSSLLQKCIEYMLKHDILDKYFKGEMPSEDDIILSGGRLAEAYS